MGVRAARRAIRRSASRAVVVTLAVGLCVPLAAGTVAAAATDATRTVSGAVAANGQWPGVGTICEGGPGGPSTGRGVGPTSIHIAVFNDQSNTVLPGLEKEFVQFADAFAAWCNAAGGIDGRHIVIDNRDAALFNAGQVTTEACQSDFMAVGGGLVLDQAAVPIREGCGLGQITGYTVSDASATASLQVNPSNLNPKYVPAGWFAALAKKYPRAVRQASMGAENNPNVLEPEHKYQDAAESLGWNVQEFQTVPLSVTDWTPYVQELQTKGIEADWPSVQADIGPYLQAVSTTGFDPAFIALGIQFYNSGTTAALKGLHLPPVYVEIGAWPLEMASQNPSTEQLVHVMHTYQPGATINFWDQEGAGAWLLWAKSASACGADLTVACVLANAEKVKNWSAGGMGGAVAQVTASDQDPVPSPCFAILRAEPGRFVYDRAITQPTRSIWNCDPKNLVKLTPQQVAALSG